MLVDRTGVKYWLNLHPDGSRVARAFQLDTFDEEELPSVGGSDTQREMRRDAIPEIRRSLVECGISGELVKQVTDVLRENSFCVGATPEIAPRVAESLRSFGVSRNEVHGA